MKQTHSLLIAAAVMLQAGTLSTPGAASSAAAENWPQWRGPDGTGVAPRAKPPLKWSGDENVKWKVELPGSGSSTPIIWGNQIFIQAALGAGKELSQTAEESAPEPRRRGRRRGQRPTEVHQFVLLSVDRGTGKINWQKVAHEEVPHEGHHQDHGFASSSPVTDGKTVVAYFGSRGLHGFDLKGNAKWTKDLGRMQTKMSFGEGSSPALHGSTLVVNWDHEGDDFIAAFNIATGEELWRQPRQEDTSWATPLIVEHEGKAQVVTGATKKIRSYDLQTGKQIWESAGLTMNAIPTPVAGDGMVFLTSGFRGNALYAIELGRTGDLTDSDAIVWSHQKATPYVPSPLLCNGRLYFFSHNNNVLSCFDAKTGRPLIDSERVEGLQGVYASPVGADGKVYLVGRNGTTAVIKDANQLEILATNPLDDRIDASPALVGNELFLRGHRYLYCVAEE